MPSLVFCLSSLHSSSIKTWAVFSSINRAPLRFHFTSSPGRLCAKQLGSARPDSLCQLTLHPAVCLTMQSATHLWADRLQAMIYIHDPQRTNPPDLCDHPSTCPPTVRLALPSDQDIPIKFKHLLGWHWWKWARTCTLVHKPYHFRHKMSFMGHSYTDLNAQASNSCSSLLKRAGVAAV